MKILIFLLLVLSPHAFGQQRMILYFKDKGADTAPVLLSERALQRRILRQVEKDEKDIPVSMVYVRELQQVGTVLHESRWLNAVSFETELSAEALMTAFQFIAKITPIYESRKEKALYPPATRAYDYGLATGQVQQINIDCMHDLGYTGENVFMAVIDAGFSGMDQIDYFDSIYLQNRLIETHNYVQPGQSVYGFSEHGTMVASCIAGNKVDQDAYKGTGFGVDLALYLTEDVASESLLEEFNLVAALERCDEIGVEIANISLGYFDFDDSTTNHTYQDLDGNTTIAALGVNTAASKGIAVVISAGNSAPQHISTPCDANDGLCVGAVDYLGGYAVFSSVGPSVDGDIKPDVSARGVDAAAINELGEVVPVSGTSFASPITAGATACLLQAHPERTIADIFNAIRMSANQYSTPDEFLGYGIPDFCMAHDILEANAGLSNVEKSELKIYPNPANGVVVISTTSTLHIHMTDLHGRVVLSDVLVNGQTELDISALEPGIYTLIATEPIQQMHRIIIQH